MATTTKASTTTKTPVKTPVKSSKSKHSDAPNGTPTVPDALSTLRHSTLPARNARSSQAPYRPSIVPKRASDTSGTSRKAAYGPTPTPTPTCSTYVHSQLGPREVRLLKLLPAQLFDDPIVVALHGRKLPSTPPRLGPGGQHQRARSGSASMLSLASLSSTGSGQSTSRASALSGLSKTSRKPAGKASSFLGSLGLSSSTQAAGQVSAKLRTMIGTGYEALSYAPSSDPKDVSPVEVQGGGILVVPHALCVALRNIRRQHRPRVLWAEEICVNVFDVKEREVQAGLRGEIFAGASRTLIWLGEESGEVEGAVNDLARWSDMPSTPSARAFVGVNLIWNVEISRFWFHFDGSEADTLESPIESVREKKKAPEPESKTGKLGRRMPRFGLGGKKDKDKDKDKESKKKEPTLEVVAQLNKRDPEISSAAYTWLIHQQAYLIPILHLLSRPWFRRKWSLTEALLSHQPVFITSQSSCAFDMRGPGLSLSPSEWFLLERIIAPLSKNNADFLERASVGLHNLRTMIELAGGGFGYGSATSLSPGYALSAPSGTSAMDRGLGRKWVEMDLGSVLLRTQQTWRSMDKRDYLFSVLGLADNLKGSVQSELLRVDYSAGRETMAARLSLWLIHNMLRPFWHFSLVEGRRVAYVPKLSSTTGTADKHPSRERTPSWAFSPIPLPRHPGERNCIALGLDLTYNAGLADQFSHCTWRVGGDGRALTIRGRLVATVARILMPRACGGKSHVHPKPRRRGRDRTRAKDAEESVPFPTHAQQSVFDTVVAQREWFTKLWEAVCERYPIGEEEVGLDSAGNLQQPLDTGYGPETEDFRSPMTEDFRSPMTDRFRSSVTEDFRSPVTEDMRSPLTEELRSPLTEDMGSPHTAGLPTEDENPRKEDETLQILVERVQPSPTNKTEQHQQGKNVDQVKSEIEDIPTTKPELAQIALQAKPQEIRVVHTPTLLKKPSKGSFLSLNQAVTPTTPISARSSTFPNEKTVIEDSNSEHDLQNGGRFLGLSPVKQRPRAGKSVKEDQKTQANEVDNSLGKEQGSSKLATEKETRTRGEVSIEKDKQVKGEVEVGNGQVEKPSGQKFLGLSPVAQQPHSPKSTNSLQSINDEQKAADIAHTNGVPKGRGFLGLSPSVHVVKKEQAVEAEKGVQVEQHPPQSPSQPVTKTEHHSQSKQSEYTANPEVEAEGNQALDSSKSEPESQPPQPDSKPPIPPKSLHRQPTVESVTGNESEHIVSPMEDSPTVPADCPTPIPTPKATPKLPGLTTEEQPPPIPARADPLMPRPLLTLQKSPTDTITTTEVSIKPIAVSSVPILSLPPRRRPTLPLPPAPLPRPRPGRHTRQTHLEMFYSLVRCGPDSSYTGNHAQRTFPLTSVERFVDIIVHADASALPADVPFAQFEDEYRAFVDGLVYAPHLQLAVLSSGHLGWVPGAAKEGDSVGVICGSEGLYVFGEAESSPHKNPLAAGDAGKGTGGKRRSLTLAAEIPEEYWNLIGEAYVQGMMWGEAMRWGEERDITMI